MAGIVWKTNTLYSGVNDAKKLLETKQGLALRRAVEVFKSGFGESGTIPVVSGRLKGSLMGKQAVNNKEVVSKEGDALEKYNSSFGGEKDVTWGSNVEYAEDVELYSKKNAGFFARNWDENTEKAKIVIKNTLNLNTKVTLER